MVPALTDVAADPVLFYIIVALSTYAARPGRIVLLLARFTGEGKTWLDANASRMECLKLNVRLWKNDMTQVTFNLRSDILKVPFDSMYAFF